ncbi:MAG: OmpA family protein [Kofleriaceae bacterium]
MRVEGHADVRGDAAYNLWLSQERADRVAHALIAAGVAPHQIDAIGLGATQPRATGDDDAAHARNRRVEFVLLETLAAAPAAEVP